MNNITIREVEVDRIFIVTEGIYDDYGIVAVFSDLDTARDFKSDYMDKTPYRVQIESYEVNQRW